MNDTQDSPLQFLEDSELQDLYKQYGIRYLKRSEYLLNLHPRQREKSRYYRRNEKEFTLLLETYGKEIQEEYFAPCRVGYLGKQLNYGLFAQCDLKKDALIGEYTGQVLINRKEQAMDDALGGYNTDYAWNLPVKKGFHFLELDGRLQSNHSRFINHSFSANLRMEHFLLDQQWILFLLCNRDIKQGEQFTVNYGEGYWTGGIRELMLI